MRRPPGRPNPILLLAAAVSLAALGACQVEGPLDVELASEVDASETDTTEVAAPSSGAFPVPDLVLDSVHLRSVSGRQFRHYDLSVANWQAYDPELFDLRSDLPPCGLNDNASRTWVEIFDAAGQRRYGFCALDTRSGLNGIWLAVPVDQEQPSGVYIELWDRERDIRVRSNTVPIGSG